MNPDVVQIRKLLEEWLSRRLTADSYGWIRDRQIAIGSGDKKSLFLAFGLAPRKVGKQDLSLSNDELTAASNARCDWHPQGWSIDQATRTLFLLSLPTQESKELVATLDQLFGAGEVGELVALYQALPLLPHAAAHVLRAAEGIRTNIKAVFCAVAHGNPYPSEQFTDDQWNQMILKCQFIGVSMTPVIGFDRRANLRLAEMVVDFIHERAAAKRPVAPGMWRCVGRFADARTIADLERLLGSDVPSDRQAAALALSESPDPSARRILATEPELSGQVASGTITWMSIESI